MNLSTHVSGTSWYLRLTGFHAFLIPSSIGCWLSALLPVLLGIGRCCLLSLDPMVDYSLVVCPCAINPWFPAPTDVPPVLRCLVPFVAAPASAMSVSQGAMSGPVSAVPFFATTPLRCATSAFCHFVIDCIPPTSCTMSRGAILQSLSPKWCTPPTNCFVSPGAILQSFVTNGAASLRVAGEITGFNVPATEVSKGTTFGPGDASLNHQSCMTSFTTCMHLLPTRWTNS